MVFVLKFIPRINHVTRNILLARASEDCFAWYRAPWWRWVSGWVSEWVSELICMYIYVSDWMCIFCLVFFSLSGWKSGWLVFNFAYCMSNNKIDVHDMNDKTDVSAGEVQMSVKHHYEARTPTTFTHIQIYNKHHTVLGSISGYEMMTTNTLSKIIIGYYKCKMMPAHY